jgi:hypothetical protein
LTQLILAVQNYEVSYRAYPPGTLEKKGPIVNQAKGYHHNWVSRVLPYIEEKNTYNHIDFAVGVYDEKNDPAWTVRMSSFECPSMAFPPAADRGFCCYAGVHHDFGRADRHDQSRRVLLEQRDPLRGHQRRVGPHVIPWRETA